MEKILAALLLFLLISKEYSSFGIRGLCECAEQPIEQDVALLTNTEFPGDEHDGQGQTEENHKEDAALNIGEITQDNKNDDADLEENAGGNDNSGSDNFGLQDIGDGVYSIYNKNDPDKTPIAEVPLGEDFVSGNDGNGEDFGLQDTGNGYFTVYRKSDVEKNPVFSFQLSVNDGDYQNDHHFGDNTENNDNVFDDNNGGIVGNNDKNNQENYDNSGTDDYGLENVGDGFYSLYNKNDPDKIPIAQVPLGENFVSDKNDSQDNYGLLGLGDYADGFYLLYKKGAQKRIPIGAIVFNDGHYYPFDSEENIEKIKVAKDDKNNENQEITAEYNKHTPEEAIENKTQVIEYKDDQRSGYQTPNDDGNTEQPNVDNLSYLGHVYDEDGTYSQYLQQLYEYQRMAYERAMREQQN